MELFFVRGGYVTPGNSSAPFRNAGQWGSYWSSRASSSTAYAYYFYFDSYVNPSGSDYRYNGNFLRCLIPTT